MGAQPEPVNLARLSDLNAVASLLQDVQLQERAVQMELEQRLLRRKDMETQLMTLVATISEVIERGRGESDALTSRMHEAAEKAQQVSSRVRRLDAAQSNLVATIDKIDVIVTCDACVRGVQAALRDGDFEAAAQYISKYRALDVQHAHFPPGSAAAMHSTVVADARARLLTVVREKLQEATASGDNDGLTRFLKLYKPLDMPDEGLRATTAALHQATAGAIAEEWSALQARIGADPSTANFLGALSRTLRAVYSAVQRYEALVADVFGGAHVVTLVHDVTRLMDDKVPRILERFVSVRRLEELTATASASATAGGPRSSGGAPDAVAIDVALNELRGLMACGSEFVAFLLRVAGTAVAPRPVPLELTEALRIGSYARAMHGLQAAYVTLESCYVDRCIAKAVELDSVLPGALMSSVLDDGFFVLKTSASRALSTGSVQCLASVLAVVATQLRGAFAAALTTKLAGAPRATVLCLEADRESSGSSEGQAALERAAAPLNNIAQSVTYVGKMLDSIEAQALQRFTGASDTEAIRSALEDLPAARAALQGAGARASDELARLVTDRLLAKPLNHLAKLSFQLTEAQYAAQEAQEGWAHALSSAVRFHLHSLRAGLAPEAAQDVERAIVKCLLERIEAVLRASRRFTMLGGLLLDRDVRILVAGLADVTGQPVRERFSRLTQMVELLMTESIDEARALLADRPETRRLDTATAKAVLSWRGDYDPSAIASLQL